MTEPTKDQLTGLLVTKLTGAKINTAEWNRTVQKAKYTLTYDKCTSTSEHEVDTAINGLVEKFSIKGRRDVSKALLEHKSAYLDKSRPLGSPNTNQSILKYDLLQLLLSLSSSRNQTYDHIPILNESMPTENNLTWEEVVKDDPLEGDHWKKWPEDTSDDDSSDNDGRDSDEESTTARQLRNNETQDTQTVNDPEVSSSAYYNQMDIDERGDPESLGFLITQQYWRDDYSLEREDESDAALLQNPCQMSDALGNLLYTRAERSRLKTIPESGVIREVISLLRGCRGVLFKYEDGQFQLDENYVLQHLSRNALGSILNEFCVFGNILSELRQIVTRVANDAKYGQTSQAFAASIYNSLMDFDGLLSELEAGSGFITRNSTASISILKLRTTLDSHLQCFKELHEITMNTPYSDANPRLISTYLISAFYDHTLIAQSSGQRVVYDTLLYVLEQLLVPYGRIIDDWIFYGSLEGDVANEFYVVSSEIISIEDPNFWTDGFSIAPVVCEYVCYPCPLFSHTNMARIFFTGKAVNLLNEIEKKLRHVQLMMHQPVSFSVTMSDFLAVKPPFITYNKASRQASSDDIGSLTMALFPMKKCQSRPNEPIVFVDDFDSLFDQDFIQFIDKYTQEPYINTADTLNKVLHNNCRLSEQLKSLASIYLMLENDLMHSFCEVLFKQIDDNELWFDKQILNSTFSEACEISGYDETVYIQVEQTDDVSPPNTITSFLELISFKVEIPWPLNNFIQREHLENYSKISSLLLRLKRAKYIMEKKTLFGGRTDYQNNDQNAMQFYSVRMKILWFINSFWRYIMTTILHAETIEFRKKLSVSKDADEITKLHTLYINTIVDRCLLNDKMSAIRKAVIGIFDMTEQMAVLFKKYMRLSSDDACNDSEGFKTQMGDIEKNFKRSNEFISVSLKIFAKKANLPWFESLAFSLAS
ncbi:Spc98 family-domain-containing protein [Mucor mucedo]|uniref:Spc98 family-domain-containing protein n=1 Tax=Mucor mucedo TaxID=29922 RepID=UPI002220690B|nr:Spc98 family-domain-containing protein [Mucor mucedo]KAI7889635.1 Spc98 family-domain-containing protein [Mucor mucedo]